MEAHGGQEPATVIAYQASSAEAIRLRTGVFRSLDLLLRWDRRMEPRVIFREFWSYPGNRAFAELLID